VTSTGRLTDSPRADALALLEELEPRASELLERHLAVAKEWFPHEYVPWSRGRDFDVEPWKPEHSTLGDIAQLALEVNLLTEDNLPSYHRLVYSGFGRGDRAWLEWVHRWTAEEGRHAIVLRDYLVVTRGLDPVALERARMAHMQRGYTRDDSQVLRGLAYVALQELATRVSHFNTGRYAGDPVAERITARIAQDENLHMLFYRELLATAADLFPDDTVEAIAVEVESFEMPGAGMADFRRKAAQIALAGIYDMRLHHDQVVLPLVRRWQVFERRDLGERGERARERLAAVIERLDTQAKRFEERRAALASRERERYGAEVTAVARTAE
jgi:acyl-[acyl-carrier-protein] desaturase